MLVQATYARPRDRHIRPISLGRDLADLADLMQVAFGPDLVATGSRMVEDLREMALWGPALRLLPGAWPLFAGYVWVEDGRVVGNISLSPEAPRGAWSLSNIAVLPEFRGRGIAGQLLDAALATIRARDGRQVFLQVRADNAVACALYAHRGFERYNTFHELGLSAGRWPIILGDPPPGMRSARWGDGSRLMRLARAATPAGVWRARPPNASTLAHGWGYHLRAAWRLAMLGESTLELVAEAAPRSGELEAWGRLRAGLGRDPYHLQLLVAPAVRGRWERRLAEALLASMRYAPRQRVRADCSLDHPQAIAALEALGFSTQRILDEMLLTLA